MITILASCCITIPQKKKKINTNSESLRFENSEAASLVGQSQVPHVTAGTAIEYTTGYVWSRSPGFPTLNSSPKCHQAVGFWDSNTELDYIYVEFFSCCVAVIILYCFYTWNLFPL